MNQSFAMTANFQTLFGLIAGVGLTVVGMLYIWALYGRATEFTDPSPHDESTEEEGFEPPRAIPWHLLVIWAFLLAFAVFHTIYVASTRTHY